MFTYYVPMSTGCTPIDLIPPCVHVFVHYGDAAQKFGVLVWYMLMAFERYNKKIKNLVGNSTHPLASLKAALLRDAGYPHTLALTPTRFQPLPITHSNAHPRPTTSGILQVLARPRGDYEVWVEVPQSHHKCGGDIPLASEVGSATTTG